MIARSAGVPAALQACVVLSLGLHLSLLPLLNPPSLKGGGFGSGAAKRVTHVSLVAPRQAEAAATERLSTARPQPGEAPAREGVRHPEGEAAPPLAAPAQLEEAGDGTYLPRTALTRAPRPRDVILVPYPVFDGDEGHYSARVSVFIDEAGMVQRLQIPPQALPAALEAAVRETFMAARFQPGELDGRPARTRLEIEVSFDSGLARP